MNPLAATYPTEAQVTYEIELADGRVKHIEADSGTEAMDICDKQTGGMAIVGIREAEEST